LQKTTPVRGWDHETGGSGTAKVKAGVLTLAARMKGCVPLMQARSVFPSDGRAQLAPATRTALMFSSAERDAIIQALSNPKHGFGARAQYFVRNCGPKVRAAAEAAGVPTFSIGALSTYMLLAGFIGADKKHPDRIAVTMRTIAGWLGCSPRSAQAYVRELVRSGPLPLLVERPGKPGKPSCYGFVSNPFEIARHQADDAARVKQARTRDCVGEPVAAAFRAHVAGDITEAELHRRRAEAYKRRNWNTATRPAVVVKPDPDPAFLRRVVGA
jgi:hypothetical protein